MLAYYSQRFHSVEVNNTFYHLIPHAAVLEWRKATPADFRFAVKGSRFLTHMKKLRDPEVGLERFFDRIELLGPKLGPILFQLPPRLLIDPERLQYFLQALPRTHRYAFEFRDPSWNAPIIYDQLRKYKAAYCIFDLAGFQSPLEVTTDFTYIRLHGPGAKYQGSYDDRALRSWAARIRRWNLKDSYIYFDNDQSAYAPRNAARLKEILHLG